MKKQKARTQRKPTQPAKVAIRHLAIGGAETGADQGGGIPEFSFNVIAGTPGCGKTALVHQIVFS